MTFGLYQVGLPALSIWEALACASRPIGPSPKTSGGRASVSAVVGNDLAVPAMQAPQLLIFEDNQPRLV